MKRKVLVIDNNRIGVFDLCSMKKISEDVFEIKVKSDEVLNSKRTKNKISKNIDRRLKFERRENEKKKEK